MRDLANHLHFVRAIPPAAAITNNTPLVSSIVDTSGYESCVFVLNIGDLADADATFAVAVEHGDQANLSDAAAVPAAGLTGTLAQAGFTFGDDNKLRKIGYVGSKRYVRLTVTPSNNTGNAFISATAVLGDGRHKPTSNPPA